MQFLGPVGSDRTAVFTATSIPAQNQAEVLRLGRYGEVHAVDPEPYEPRHASTLSDDAEEELELLEAADVEALVRQALARGAPPFVAGAEVSDGIAVEAMWPDQGVGIAAEGAVVPTELDVRVASGWSVEELLSKLGVE